MQSKPQDKVSLTMRNSGPEPTINNKITNNWSADNIKKHVPSIRCMLEPMIQSCDTVSR